MNATNHIVLQLSSTAAISGMYCVMVYVYLLTLWMMQGLSGLLCRQRFLEELKRKTHTSKKLLLVMSLYWKVEEG